MAADPDAMELTAELAAGLQPLRGRGRPALEQPQLSMTMRVDADVLEAIKATGAGWQPASTRCCAKRSTRAS